jgi:hypothetical protein
VGFRTTYIITIRILAVFKGHPKSCNFHPKQYLGVIKVAKNYFFPSPQNTTCWKKQQIKPKRTHLFSKKNRKRINFESPLQANVSMTTLCFGIRYTEWACYMYNCGRNKQRKQECRTEREGAS